MAVGDFEGAMGIGVNGLPGVPAQTITDWYSIISATNITGMRKRAQERTINRGWHRRRGKPDKWEILVDVQFHLDVHRCMKLIAALFGSTAATTLTAGAYEHTITPNPAEQHHRTFRCHFNRNGRVYEHFNMEPLYLSITQGDEFWDCQLTLGSTHVAHCQAFPTNSSLGTYNGILHSWGIYKGSATTAASYEIDIVTGGLPDGTATVRTRIAGGTYTAAYAITEDTPMPIMTQVAGQDTESGMYMVFGRGTAEFNIAAFGNGAGDNVTVTVDGTPTVFTEGVEFSRGASNAECAYNLQNAINLALYPASVRAVAGTSGATNVVRIYRMTGVTTVATATSDVTFITVDTEANGRTLTNTDAWTVSSRGTVIAGTAPDHTVFSPNSFEIKTFTYDGSAFEIDPAGISLTFESGKRRDEYTLRSPYPRAYEPQTHCVVTMGFRARAIDARFIQDSNHGEDRTVVMMMEGRYISTTAYRERIQFTVLTTIDPGTVEDITQDFQNYHEVKATGAPSTDTALDFFTGIVRSDEDRLDT